MQYLKSFKRGQQLENSSKFQNGQFINHHIQRTIQGHRRRCITARWAWLGNSVTLSMTNSGSKRTRLFSSQLILKRCVSTGVTLYNYQRSRFLDHLWVTYIWKKNKYLRNSEPVSCLVLVVLTVISHLGLSRYVSNEFAHAISFFLLLFSNRKGALLCVMFVT